MDKIRALRYFIKVAETNSFSAAAQYLDVPASSVSRRIKDLETELQVELFHRSTRVVKLSDLGELYYEKVSSIVHSLDNVDDFINQRAKQPSGSLKISVMPGFANLVLYPLLDKFQEQYPEIILDLDLTNQLADITQNEVDIAIRGTASLPDRAVAKKLCNNEFVLVASPEYLALHDTPNTWQDTLDHPTLLYRGPNGVRYWQAFTEHSWHTVQTTPRLISNDGILLLNETRRGKGLCLLPRWGIYKDLADGSLVEIPLTNAQLSVSRALNRGIYLLYLRPRYPISKIKTVVDFLVEEFSTFQV